MTQVSIAWRGVLKWGVRLSTGASAILGFVALEPLIAGSLGVALLGLNIILERIRFYAHVLHVTPFPSDHVIRNKLASMWGVEECKGKPAITFGQVFRTRRAAKEAYQLLRAWNFGDYIDRHGNIALSIVREELDRFTILLYPGERGIAAHASDQVRAVFGDRTNPVLSKVVFWFVTYADYWNRPKMKAVVDNLPACSRVLLNCYFVQNGELQPVARRHLELSKIVIIHRAEVPEGSLESCFNWEGPWAGFDHNSRAQFEPVVNAVNAGGDARDSSTVWQSADKPK